MMLGNSSDLRGPADTGTLVGLLKKHVLGSENYPAAIRSLCDTLDRKIATQLDLVLQHEDFRCLRRAWAGLRYLVSQVNTSESLKIEVLDLSKAELAAGLWIAHEARYWDQSPIFKMIHEMKFGGFGGEPYGCMLGDFYFDHGERDLAILGAMGKVAQASQTPFITGAAPSIAGLSAWEEYDHRAMFQALFRGSAFEPWRFLRRSNISRYLGLCMPRIRVPATADADCLVNSAYAMGVNVARAFELFGWITRIGGAYAGGEITGLAGSARSDGETSDAPPARIECAIDEEDSRQLCDAGLMTAVSGQISAFFCTQSLHEPERSEDDEATVDAVLAARFSYLFNACRFAQYLKCICRDHNHRFRSREELERFLNGWLRTYVDSEPSFKGLMQHRSLLQIGEVSLEEDPDLPYRSKMRLKLKPVYQSHGYAPVIEIETHVDSPLG